MDRPTADTRIAENTVSLHCKRRVEPGCVDPDFLHASACTVSRCSDLRSIYVSGRSHRSLVHLIDRDFQDTTGLSRLRKVSFVGEREVRMFSTEWSKDPTLWTKLRGSDKEKKKRSRRTNEQQHEWNEHVQEARQSKKNNKQMHEENNDS